jgi:hypothetical protein
MNFLVLQGYYFAILGHRLRHYLLQFVRIQLMQFESTQGRHYHQSQQQLQKQKLRLGDKSK